MSFAIVIGAALAGVAQAQTVAAPANVLEQDFDPKDYAYVYLAGIFFILSGATLLLAGLLRCCCNAQRDLVKRRLTDGEGGRRLSKKENALVKRTIDDVLESGEMEGKSK